MADDFVEEYKIKTDESIARLRDLVNSLTNYNKAIDNVTRANLQFNAQGQIARATMRGLVDSSTAMTAAFIENEKGSRLVSLGFERIRGSSEAATRAIMRQWEEAKKLNNAFDAKRNFLPPSQRELDARAGSDMASIINKEERERREARERQRRMAGIESRAWEENARRDARRVGANPDFQEAIRLNREMEAEEERRAERDRRAFRLRIERRRERDREAREEARRAAEEEIHVQQMRGRNAAAFGASLGAGAPNFSALGRSLHSTRLGVSGNFALGLGAGAVGAGLDKLVNVARDGADDAVEFNKQLALIQTITKDGSSTTDKWASSLRSLAREFNASEIDVAAGAYQALSNQIIKGVDDLEFMRQALILAKATNATTAESVNALSSIMNSYGMRVGEAASLSDKLFKAVDLGNFKLSDVANSMGRVTAMAAPLGISISEVLASIETATIKGLSPDEVLSSVSNLYSEMLKPSEQLAASMKRLGFETAQQGISTLRYSGFLKAVIEDSKKYGVSVAELFPNIRGLREALLEANDGFVKFNENLRQTEKSANDATKALGEVERAAGYRTTQALNSLKISAESVWTGFLGTSDQVLRFISELDKKGFQGALLDSTPSEQGRIDAEQAASLRIAQSQGKFPSIEQPLESSDMLLASMGITPLSQALVNSKSFEDIFKERQLKIAQVRTAQNLAHQDDISGIKRSTAEYLNGMEKRRESSEEVIAKLAQSQKKAQLEAALKVATPEQATRLLEEHMTGLASDSEAAFAGASKLKGKSFLNDKGLDDARRMLAELVEMRAAARDKAIATADKGEAFAAVTGGPGARGAVIKAEEALVEAKQKQVDLEQKIQALMKQRAEQERAVEKERIAFLEKEALVRDLKAKADKMAGDPSTNPILVGAAQAEVIAAQQALMDSKPTPSGHLTVEAGRAAWLERKKQLQAIEDADRERHKGFRSGSSTDRAHAAGAYNVLNNLYRSTMDAPWDIDSEGEMGRGMPWLLGPLASLRAAAGISDFGPMPKMTLEERKKKAAEAATAAGGFIGRGSTSMTGMVPTAFDEIEAQAAKTVPALKGVINVLGDLEAAAADFGATQDASKLQTPLSLDYGSYQATQRGGNNVTNVGGINITVRGGNTAPETVQKIGRGLKRGMRRGTIRIQ
jgi:TP901 family phage tail tape measure protein